MDAKTKFKIIQNLVGSVTEQVLERIQKNVELYMNPKLGIFVPSFDYCDYAISPQHTHPGYSFIYNLSGSAAVKVRDTIQRSPYKNKANICAFSPDVPHEEIVEDQFKSYFAICIDKYFYESQLKKYKNIKKITFEGNYFLANETILYTLKRFIVEHEDSLPGREELLDSLALEVTHLLIRHCYKISSSEIKVSQKIEINQLISFLNENFANKISVQEMAKKVNLSSSHFSAVFKEETGFSPTNFLIDLRIQKAKKLLLQKDTNITQIALDCGFSSSAYFAVCFKERTGFNPSEYSKKINSSIPYLHNLSQQMILILR